MMLQFFKTNSNKIALRLTFCFRSARLSSSSPTATCASAFASRDCSARCAATKSTTVASGGCRTSASPAARSRCSSKSLALSITQPNYRMLICCREKIRAPVPSPDSPRSPTELPAWTVSLTSDNACDETELRL